MKLFERFRVILSSFRPLHILGILILFCIFVFGFLSLAYKQYKKILVDVPTYGGSVTEALIGNPRFINPVLAVSETDKSISSVVYSGLMKIDSVGNIVTDMADAYDVSDDGLTYTFTIKDAAVFHDGKKVTSEDVVYTIQLIQNEQIKSPRKIEWEGVKAENLDENTVRFTLKKPYPEFLKKTTIGILPKHIWSTLDFQTIPLSDYNLSPIGSGPFEISDVKKKSGIITEYTLTAFSSYTLGRPFMDSLTFKIYKDNSSAVEALKNKDIMNISGLNAKEASFFQDSSRLSIRKYLIPREYVLFFNQSKNSVLIDKNVRQAINASIDNKKIITEAIYGYANQSNGPIPKTYLGKETQDTTSYNTEESKRLLKESGWEKADGSNYYSKDNNELSVTITTIKDVPELEQTASIIQTDLEVVGIKSTIQSFDISEINQRVIKDRDYEILLYGISLNQPSDLYAFWHSSQKNYPGLNLSNYASTKVDSALENIRSLDSGSDEYLKNLQIIETEINTDLPAIFLFEPNQIYLTDSGLKKVENSSITSPSERLNNINTWYRYTEKVWRGLDNIEILKSIRSRIY